MSDGVLRMVSADGTKYISMSPLTTASANIDWTWPTNAGSGGQALLTDGTNILSWGTPSTAAAHNILAATHTDATTGTVLRGDLIIGQSATPKWNRKALGASGTILRSDGTDALWSATTLITELGTITTGTWNADTITVAFGGTGATTLTDGGILLGSGTGAITALEVASNGQIPIGDGATDPVLATITGGVGITTTNGAGTISLAFDSTEIDATTWSDGANASNVWTFDVSGTDPTMTFGSDLVTFSNSITVATGKNFTLGSTQWNSADEIDGTKIKDADYGDVDVSAGGAWTVSSVQVNSVALGTDTTGDYVSDITGGAGIDSTGATSGENISHTLSFDSTEVSGNRTWSDASTDTIVWTWDRATGTDPTMTVGNALLTFNSDLSASSFLTGTTNYLAAGILSNSGAGQSAIAFDGTLGTLTLQTTGPVADIILEVGKDLIATTASGDMSFTPAATKNYTVTTSGSTANITLDSGASSNVVLTGVRTQITSSLGLQVSTDITVNTNLILASGSITDLSGTINFGNEILTTIGQGQFSSVLITGINQASSGVDAVDVLIIATPGTGGAASGVGNSAGAGSDVSLSSGDGGVAANIDGTGGRGGNIFLSTGDGGDSTNQFGFSAGNGGNFTRTTGGGGDGTGITSGDGGDGGFFKIILGALGTSVAGSAGVDGFFEVGDDTNVTHIARDGSITQEGTATMSANGFHVTITTKTNTDYTLTINDDVVLFSTGATTRTATLPVAATVTGKIYYIKKIDVGAGLVTIDGNGSETIDGDLTPDVTAQYESFTLISDGSNWHIL